MKQSTKKNIIKLQIFFSKLDEIRDYVIELQNKDSFDYSRPSFEIADYRLDLIYLIGRNRNEKPNK